jgi:hypothetical protein
MANRRISGNTYKGAIIDTAPGASGFWSDPVNASDHKVHVLILSISGIFAGTVRLQYRAVDDPGWTTYETYEDTAREIIEDHTNCEWRVGMASGGFTSGLARVRIEYHDKEN